MTDAKLDLTHRQIEVLTYLANGLQNKEIAANMGIATSTLKNHLRSIFRILDVENRMEAATESIRLGIVKL